MKTEISKTKWWVDAIWYQVLPERFRNGCPGSNPKVEHFPWTPPPSWQVTPWGQQWYEQEPWAQAKGSFYDSIFDRRYGGDLVGLKDKLDYLQELGINAIYLNPVFTAPSLHKYDASCWHHIDPTFGPDAEGDFKKLAEASETEDPATWIWTAADLFFFEMLEDVHQRGMRLILDGVFNHTGSWFFAHQDLMENGKQSRYAEWYDIRKWKSNGRPEVQGWADHAGLPQLARSENDLHPEVGQYVFDCTSRWMNPDLPAGPSRGIDGWRLDVAYCVPHGFWKRWRKHVKALNPEAYITGEIVDWAQDWLKGDEFDAVMNYRWLFPVVVFFGGGTDALSTESFKEKMDELGSAYSDKIQRVMQNLLDSHDVGRVLSMIKNNPSADWMDFDAYFQVSRKKTARSFDITGPVEEDRKKFKQMVIFQFCWPGAPMIYYGTEAGMWGANDPDNRKPMLWSDIESESETQGPRRETVKAHVAQPDEELFSFYQTCIQLRQHHEVLRRGKTEWIDPPVAGGVGGSASPDTSTGRSSQIHGLTGPDLGDRILAFSRTLAESQMQIYLNVSDEDLHIGVKPGSTNAWTGEVFAGSEHRIPARGWLILNT